MLQPIEQISFRQSFGWLERDDLGRTESVLVGLDHLVEIGVEFAIEYIARGEAVFRALGLPLTARDALENL